MASMNKKAEDSRVDKKTRLAGGFGAPAAKQDSEALLRRAVMANLLWEDMAYEDGKSAVENIEALIPNVAPEAVAAIAVEAKLEQKLRHVPLLIVAAMTSLGGGYREKVRETLEKVIVRPDDMTEFLSLYWRKGRKPLAASVKRALAASFRKFDEYQLAKWSKSKSQIKLVDVLRMVHPKPENDEQAQLWGRLRRGELAVPDTWEVALSSGSDKKAAWTRLIEEKKLGALAIVRNLRNMEEAGVRSSLIREAVKSMNTRWLLPLSFYAAAKEAPKYMRELEESMLKSFANAQKLPGHTIFVVDLSGSMGSSISSKSKMSRMEAAMAMAMVADAMCERCTVYATAGSDWQGIHATERVAGYRGFALVQELVSKTRDLGGGGIFTRQALEYIKKQEDERPDRIIVFSDSQDCDRTNKVPAPFGTHNYIVDVSAHSRGVNYRGVWTAEISGWSEKFLDYIRAYEGIDVAEVEGMDEDGLN